MSLHWKYCGQSTTTKTKKKPSPTTLSSQLFLLNHQRSFQVDCIYQPICCQCVINPFSNHQANKEFGISWKELCRICRFIISSEVSSRVHQIAPTLWTLDTAEPEPPSVRGQSPGGYVAQSTHASYVFTALKSSRGLLSRSKKTFEKF